MTKITLGLVLAAALASILVLAQTEVSFKKDVQSILDKNCTGCHGAKKQKAGQYEWNDLREPGKSLTPTRRWETSSDSHERWQ